MATGAAAAILHYLRDTQRTALDHLERPAFYNRADALILDATTVRNLELVEPLFAGESKESTLLHVLDRTRTGMGGRLLRRRLLAPSIDVAEIEGRLDAVRRALWFRAILRADLGKHLESILDLERLLAKISLSSAGPRDLLALARSLAVVPSLASACHSSAALLQDIQGRLDQIPEVRDRVLSAIAEEPPVNLSDGGTIRTGFDAALDELRDISQNSRTYLAQIEQRERTRTGIASLKVRFNNVFGYYIEISKSNLHLAPADYERKQTLVNAERFTTPELKELEVKILEAEEKIARHRARDLRAASPAGVRHMPRASKPRRLPSLRWTSRSPWPKSPRKAATCARDFRPKVTTGEMRVVAGRHPVIEKLAEKDAAAIHPQRSLFPSRHRIYRRHHRP